MAGNVSVAANSEKHWSKVKPLLLLLLLMMLPRDA